MKEGVRKALAAYNRGSGSVSGIIKKHDADWINHIHEDGRSHIKDIGAIRNSKKKYRVILGKKVKKYCLFIGLIMCIEAYGGIQKPCEMIGFDRLIEEITVSDGGITIPLVTLERESKLIQF